MIGEWWSVEDLEGSDYDIIEVVPGHLFEQDSVNHENPQQDSRCSSPDSNQEPQAFSVNLS
jgi:hypothetical protein